MLAIFRTTQQAKKRANEVLGNLKWKIEIIELHNIEDGSYYIVRCSGNGRCLHEDGFFK